MLGRILVVSDDGLAIAILQSRCFAHFANWLLSLCELGCAYSSKIRMHARLLAWISFTTQSKHWLLQNNNKQWNINLYEGKTMGSPCPRYATRLSFLSRLQLRIRSFYLAVWQLLASQSVYFTHLGFWLIPFILFLHCTTKPNIVHS